MFHISRLSGRFFCCLSLGIFLLTLNARLFAAPARTTRVTDTVYRADGTPARGTILISWPAFTAATGEAVAAGKKTVTIGADGLVDVPLVANTGSTPGSFYTVVLQLDNGATATEYWTVPAALSTTIAAIRSKVVPAGLAVQFVGRDYVDSADAAARSTLTAALAAKADDTAVVHYAGEETIAGVKTFAASPAVPAPTSGAHAANKSYVDSAVQGSLGNAISANPAASQVVTQPSGTSLQVNRADLANLNGVRHADRFGSIQAAIDDAGTTGSVVIPPGYTGQDNFTNPQNRTVLDLRKIGDARGGVISVKDFGARGDGGFYSAVACTGNSSTFTGVGNELGRLPRVGDTFVVSGCGAGGADLQCTLSSVSGVAYGSVTCGGGVKAAATLGNRGARWGASVDDTPAFTAAMDFCKTGNPNGGCRLSVPSGVYFVSNIVFPSITGPQAGQVMVTGAGRASSWIVGIGADQTAIFEAPAGNPVSTYISDLGFDSYDYWNKQQKAVAWLGGQEHTFTNNYASNVYNCVYASNTWINLISNNRCYVTKGSNIEFNGVVNATRTVFNELSNWGYGPNGYHDTAQHAYWVHGAGGSYGNTFAFNSIEHTNGPLGEPTDTNDTLSQYIGEYYEVNPSVSGYTAIFRGQTNQIHGLGWGCVQLLGPGNTLYGPSYGTCPSQTYSVKNDSLGNIFYGMTPSALSTLNQAVVYGLPSTSAGKGAALQVGEFKVLVDNGLHSTNASPYNAGAVQGLHFGLVLGEDPYYAGTAGNVWVPNFWGTFRSGDRIPNANWSNNNYSWFGDLVCMNGAAGCSQNGSSWNGKWGYTQVSQCLIVDGTAAPASGVWNQCDYVRNTSPASGGTLGWLNVASGSPGTWVPVTHFDPASPAALGATAPNTVKATTVNATTGFQVNGTALVSSCGTTTACSNTAVGTARTLTGSVALTSGTATVTGISPAFTSTSSFVCTCTDRAATPAACSVQNASTSSITVKGTGTDTVNYMCIGN